MNFSIFRRTQGALSGFVKCLMFPNPLHFIEKRGNHQLCNNYFSTLASRKNQNSFKPMNFLTPILPLFNQVCGMKQRGHLQLRCRGCYYVSRQGRLYVMCRLKPRHKQMQMMKSFEKRRILTSVQQKRQRDWY